MGDHCEDKPSRDVDGMSERAKGDEGEVVRPMSQIVKSSSVTLSESEITIMIRN